MPDEAPLDASTWASESQRNDAPPLAVKVNVTGPGATSDSVSKGIATSAPGVVVTAAGPLSLATATCAGSVNVTAIEALPPAASDTSITSDVSSPA